MKYVIDIDEYTYREALTHGGNSGKLVIAVRNGKPFDDVLDKIRAEIESIIGEHNSDDYDFCSGLICARKIIDKYKRGENG